MLDRLLGRKTAPAWFLLVLFAVYASTAHYGGNVFNDVHSAAHAAWSLATRGTLDLAGVDLAYDQAWTVRVGDAEYSNRFPGVILAGVPFYLLLQPEQPLVAPSALAASLASAIGVTGMLIALRRLVPTRWAWASASLLGLGTGVWSVGADGLYTHGVTTMWLGLTAAGVVLAGRAQVLAVLGSAMAVLTRPHMGAGLAVMALVLWRRDRRGSIAVLIGTAIGSIAFLTYGRVVFGEWSVMGPYQVYDYSRAVADDPTRSSGEIAWRLENTAMAFVAPRVGLLPAYPVLLLVVWASLRNRTRPPVASIALAAAGVAYMAVALYLTRVSGGSGFWGNRTLIETVVLVWPLATCVVSAHRGSRTWRALLTAMVSWSTAFHALGAVAASPAPSAESQDAYGRSTIMFWQVPAALRASEPWQIAFVVSLGVVAAIICWRLSRPPTTEPDEEPAPEISENTAAQPASTADSTSQAMSMSESSTSR